MRHLSPIAAMLFLSLLIGGYACNSSKKTVVAPTPPSSVVSTVPAARVLVFGKTAGFKHESIPVGMAALMELGRANNIIVDTTRDAGYFIQDSLQRYNAVVFMSTTMNVLNQDQQVAFERFIQAGGGFMGVHAAADTEYDWPWYNKLVGAYFLSHPKQQKAVIDVKDKSHPATAFLPDRWERFDEWYNYKNINPDIKVLATLDETTYEGGANGDAHPIIWYHEFDGGRSFYTGLGHTNESYKEPLFLQHLLAGLKYVIGERKGLDYSKAYSIKSPEDNRFTKTVLSNDLNEPMELTVAPDGRVFFTERAGKFYVYDPAAKSTRLLRDFPVKAVDKYLNGLVGITLDPDFVQNNWIYFFYSSNRGEQYMQKISRFKISSDNMLDTASEQVIIEVPIDLEVSAHTGGSLAWDRDKNLYIGTGDNTVPFESHGYAPIDERPGRLVYDAQRSAGNPNDLRGKILRIHPEPDGTYTVPDGNLFPKGMAGTRPEIYVMGCRNPYRISVDTATSIVYWGEIGPDAGVDSDHGPRGFDEFNQAKKAGNFGWPYFVGNSIAYHDSDFATKAIGPLYDAAAPVNNSPNNTGIKNLPPATAAMIYYPYNRSPVFPALEQGGRCAMGGPVYHYNPAAASPNKLPAYYDKAFFIYDWMRNWVMAVRLDEQQNYKRMEPFMGTNGDFRRPVDIEIGPDGVMYMLEYGSVYGIDNEDARLVRIDFNEGNRAPVAKIASNDTVGAAPLTVKLNRRATMDFDEADALKYEWEIEGKRMPADKPDLSYTFNNVGKYNAVLHVRDASGAQSSDTVLIRVGNSMPAVAINTTSNSTFFFPKTTALNYAVKVEDKEDKAIDKKNLNIGLTYIPKVARTETVMGHQQLNETYNLGKVLMQSSDCKACHQINAKSVGPSFIQVSKKYQGNPAAVSHLANKIITGGGGVWGEHAMNAHPQLSREDASEIVKYILSLSVQQGAKALPQQGSVVLSEHDAKSDQARYILTASYTDAGGSLEPLTGKQILVLRPSRVQAEEGDAFNAAQKGDRGAEIQRNGGYVLLKGIDLTDVDSLRYRYAAIDKASTLELHLGSPKGPVVSKAQLAATGDRRRFAEVIAPLDSTRGKHDLYFVFVKPDTPNTRLASLDWVQFVGGREVKVKSPSKMAQKDAPEKATPVKKTETTTASKAVAKPTTGGNGAALIAKSDCATCHMPAQKLIGPSYKDIAKRYKKGNHRASLAQKIITGGAGVWGEIPMTGHPKLSKQDATAMVDYILSLK